MINSICKSWLVYFELFCFRQIQIRDNVASFRIGSKCALSEFWNDLTVEYKILSPAVIDEEGGFVILHIEIQGNPYIISNYYGPNDESSQVIVLRLLAEKLKTVNVVDNRQFILSWLWITF